jgi:hypothetical protein
MENLKDSETISNNIKARFEQILQENLRIRMERQENHFLVDENKSLKIKFNHFLPYLNHG